MSSGIPLGERSVGTVASNLENQILSLKKGFLSLRDNLRWLALALLFASYTLQTHGLRNDQRRENVGYK